MEDAGNDADNACCDVVGNDATRVEGVEPFRTPRGLYSLKVSGHAVGIRDPHAGAKDAGEVEGTEAEAAEASEQQVDAEDLGEVKGRLASARVLPDLQIPVGPVPNGGQHQQATENDVSSCHTFKTPEAGVDTGGTGDTPAAPAIRHAQASHERHDKHALAPHGVEHRVGGIEDGQLIERHGAGPAGNQGSVHEVHGEQTARVVNHDRVHPIPGQSHGGQVRGNIEPSASENRNRKSARSGFASESQQIVDPCSRS